MSKLPIALGSLTAIVAGVFVALAVAGVFDSGSGTSPGDGEEADTAALCVEGTEVCDDTGSVPVGDDVATDNGGEPTDAPPPDGSGDASGTCLVGTPDCNDTPGDPDPVLPTSSAEGEALAIEAAFAALAEMGGPPASEVDVSGVEAVDWNDACLGVETEGLACAQVITPGYIVYLSAASGDYEFHTDTTGHAVPAE